MNQSAFTALVVAAAAGGSLHNATGQMINPTVQTAPARVAASRSAPATVAKPVASARAVQQVAPRSTALNPARFNASLPRAVAQPPPNLQRTYLPIAPTSNPNFAALANQRSGPVQQPISVDPTTRQPEVHTLAAIRQRRGIVTRDGNILDPATRQSDIHAISAMREPRTLVSGQANTLDSATRETESRTLQKMHENQGFGTGNRTFAAIDPQRHITNRNPGAGPQGEKPEAPKDGHGRKWRHKKDHISHDEAFRRHWHEWHDRNWWHDHCNTIVFVTTGYYFLDGSYWYPAYGYDPLHTYYDYDGPIYTYSNLLPDEVIANVQTALQDAGYYYGPITGSLSVDTRAAIANFQRDYGLTITGAIDEPTVGALGLDQTDDPYQMGQGY